MRKIKIIVKTKVMETDSGVGISTKEGVLCIMSIDVHLKYMSICFD